MGTIRARHVGLGADSEALREALPQSYPFFAAFFAAHRFLSAATMAALPAALSLRFAFFGALCGAAAPSFLTAAHLLRCVSAIALRPAALIVRRA